MPSSFTEVFGGQNVDPSQLDYNSISIAENTTLTWPFEAVDGSIILASKIDVEATEPSLSITFPSAALVSNGQDALIKNVGAETFSVLDADGATIGSVASGESWFYYLTDNSTEAGVWESVEFGAGTSTANAAALAGAGLRAAATRLDQNLPITVLAGAYAPGVNDRATMLRNTGGSVTYAPVSAATLGDGWFVYVHNAGSGTVTWNPDGTEQIDDASTKVFQPTESAIIFCDGSNFWTVGYGRSIVSTVTAASINIAGTGTIALSAAQTAAQVQNFTGALTGNRIVEYGTGVGYWFVYNNTSGAYTTTLRVNGADPGVVVAQGTYSIVRSDGTNLTVAFTATTGTVTLINTTAGELTGGPISTTGTLGLANTAVTPGTYGAASKTLVQTVDAKGRLTADSEVDIAITASQVTDLQAAIRAYMLTLEPVGTLKALQTNTLTTGWLWANGQTIGNGSSNATQRANADTADLFTALWNDNSGLAIYTSAGAVTTRGVSAAADFAANKALALPDYRGRIILGRDTMGTAGPSNRVTNAVSGIDAPTLGATGGDQRQQQHTHSVTDAGHNHGVTDPGHAHSVSYGSPTAPNSDSVGGPVFSPLAGQATTTEVTGLTVNTNTTGISIQNTGAGSSQNMPPVGTANVIIKFS